MIVIKVLFFLTSIISKPGKNWAWVKLKFLYKNMPCSCQCGKTFFPLYHLKNEAIMYLFHKDKMSECAGWLAS